MRQLVQELDTGRLRIVEVPAPVPRAGGVLVRTTHSVISVGTERAKVELGRRSLLGKALERPDQVRKVLDTVGREGLGAAYDKVRSRLSEFSHLGYSSAGVVERVGAGVATVAVGDLVACAGAGHANHAERAWVPANLFAVVPRGVGSEEAAFTTLGAIALQGVRQADVRLGETVVVIGLGLLGQLTVQLLKAAGVRPIAVDLDADRVGLAAAHGAIGVLRSEDVAEKVLQATAGIGADAVIITAATDSADPVELAGVVARERGRVVVVGAVSMDVPRSPYYEKELELRLSRSYGPGRYDPDYEEKGHDYPIGYVRWTEQRNMAAFLDLLARGSVRLDRLITDRFDFDDVERAYDRLDGRGAAGALGVVVRYSPDPTPEPPRIVVERDRQPSAGRPGIGLVGAGSFARGVLLPALRKLDARLVGVSTAGGLTARRAAETHGFQYAASTPSELFADPDIDAVLIATRHGDHAALATAALTAGKAVFVEKPLAIEEAGLEEVLAAASNGPPLMVGFNRRFAPSTRFIRKRLQDLPGARVVQIRVNAGAIPPDSWVHDSAEGGGRLIGEGCHFIDLAIHLAGSPAVRVEAAGLRGPDPAAALQDNVVVILHLADGSLASVLYTAKGALRAGKERVEVFAAGHTGVIDDFRTAEWIGRKRERRKGRQDKGHRDELAAFLAAVTTGARSPIPLHALENSSRATLAAAASLRERTAVPVPA